MQWDHVKFCQNIVEVHNQVMKPTMAPPSVELGMSSNVESSAAYIGPPPSKKVSVGRNNESGAPAILHPPPHVKMLVGKDNELGAMKIMQPTLCMNVFFGCTGGPDASRELGASKLDIPLHTHHPLSPR